MSTTMIIGMNRLMNHGLGRLIFSHESILTEHNLRNHFSINQLKWSVRLRPSQSDRQRVQYTDDKRNGRRSSCTVFGLNDVA